MAKGIVQCRFCETRTHNPDRICAICEMKGMRPEPVEKEEAIVPGYKEKKCGCGVMFKPSGPRTLRCDACRAKKPTKKLSAKETPHEDAVSGLINMGYKKRQTVVAVKAAEEKGLVEVEAIFKDALVSLSGEHPTEPPVKQVRGGVTARKKNKPPKYITPKPSGNGDIGPITLDFTQYPLLHRKLIEEAEKDFRPPELEALYLLNNTFERMERTLQEAAN